MGRADNDSKDVLSISIEQNKLLSSAIRIQILYTISSTSKTAKQVADILGQTPGNVHYHMQRLYEGGLIELVETRENGGIVEKYYKANHTSFRVTGNRESDSQGNQINTYLLVTEQETEQLMAELSEVLVKWESRVPRADKETPHEIRVMINLQAVKKEAE
ncbi:ArsR/SmtB family transcription factor [Brevibacillus sp. H7]|uniref:ArsR/SmtB family transcription factor n=1 Tax=Brevibacillus sp. H7 TaxID=3349138 RepID=UPI003806AD63